MTPVPHPTARCTIGRTIRYDGTTDRARHLDVPVEVPVNIVYGGIPYAVMMATPADLDDFIIGFSFTEGVIAGPDEIRAITIEETRDGLVARVDLVGAALGRHLARRRSLSGRTSCGVCGIESLDQIPRGQSVVAPGVEIAPAAIERALRHLESHQPLHAVTRAVHAAAWCGPTGDILLAREDVGRHNALDKMIGGCLQKGFGPQAGFLVLTSRCSFEMIEKAAIFGAATVVAISAPTSLAIDRAMLFGIRLLAVARHDTAVVFTQAGASPQRAVAS